MFKIFRWFVVVFLGITFQVPAGEWEYDDRYKDELLFLHAFVNYDFNPEWYFFWEENRLRKNQTRMSFGSVEINDLLCNYHTVVNAPLARNWWFRLDHRYYASQHLDDKIEYLFMGFERVIYGIPVQ